MTLHDLFKLLLLPDRNIGVQYIIYTSEYILKLQIHQHSLLNRNVVSRHNLSAQFFFSRSSLDHHQFWIITGSLSSLDHHWIIKSESSLDLDHHWIINSGSSLGHQVWIIIGSSSLDHHWIIKSRSSSLLPSSRINGAISQFFSS